MILFLIFLLIAAFTRYFQKATQSARVALVSFEEDDGIRINLKYFPYWGSGKDETWYHDGNSWVRYRPYLVQAHFDSNIANALHAFYRKGPKK